MSRRVRTALAAALAVAATAASAQEASRDRADLDLAAGHAVPVRVVLPSPYGR
jgi:hypothetical protein